VIVTRHHVAIAQFLSLSQCINHSNAQITTSVITVGLLDSLPTLQVVNSCFVRNTVNGFGTVAAFFNTDVSESNNFGLVAAESVSCQFLAESDVVPVLDEEVTCTNFSANECSFDLAPYSLAPTGAPVSPPVEPTAPPTPLSSGSLLRFTYQGNLYGHLISALATASVTIIASAAFTAV
jgi:hypothetical protein